MRIIIILLLFLGFNATAQKITTNNAEKSFTWQLKPCFEAKALRFAKSYYRKKQDDTLQITTLKFYLSKVELYEGDSLVWAEKNSFHLLDATDLMTCTMNFNIPKTLKFNNLRCQIGIDSLTNMEGAGAGDLDATKGMYWTWQSGYINFKLEGVSAKCPTRKHQFEFHLGGYTAPLNSLQFLKLPIKNQKRLVTKIDIAHFLDTIDLKTTHSIMMPDVDAMRLARRLPLIFE